METNEPLEPMEHAPPRRPSRAKSLIAGLAIAGVLTGVGAMSVLAASPQPSSSGAPTASDDGSGSGSGSDHVCPDHSANGSDFGTESDSGSGSSNSSSST